MKPNMAEIDQGIFVRQFQSPYIRGQLNLHIFLYE
jgi:hypothetical protein